MIYFLDKTITLQRQRKLDGTRSVFSATGTAAGYKASKQEPNSAIMQMYDGQLGNLFVFYVDVTNPCTDGWKVVHNGIKYSVRDVKVMDFGSTQYKRIIVSKGA